MLNSRTSLRNLNLQIPPTLSRIIESLLSYCFFLVPGQNRTTLQKNLCAVDERDDEVRESGLILQS